MEEILRAQIGSWVRETKTPLMNTRGNLIVADSIMMVLGMLVGAAESVRPNEEKQKAARIVAEARVSGL